MDRAIGLHDLEARVADATGTRASYLLAAEHVPAALAALGVVRSGDRLVVFADDFEAAFAERFAADALSFVAEPSVAAFAAASEGFTGGYGSGAPHLWWFVNSIGGFGLRVPDLRTLGHAARDAGALLVVDNTVASFFGCEPLRMGAVLSLEALDRVCGGAASRKLVAISVARSQLKRHRVDAAAEEAYRLVGERGIMGAALEDAELALVESSLDTARARMQAHFDHARALAEYLAANEMVSNVCYPGLPSHPDHAAATGVLEHGFGPAVEFDLPEGLCAGGYFAALPSEFRSAPAGGPTTRLSAPRGKDARTVRLFAGTDDPLTIAATLDLPLRDRLLSGGFLTCSTHLGASRC